MRYTFVFFESDKTIWSEILVFGIQIRIAYITPIRATIHRILSYKVVGSSNLSRCGKPYSIHRCRHRNRRIEMPLPVVNMGGELMSVIVRIDIACRRFCHTNKHYYICLCRIVLVIFLLIEMPNSITFGDFSSSDALLRSRSIGKRCYILSESLLY